jgi:phosphopantetheinyl transferase (holo-ACP synthase)
LREKNERFATVSLFARLLGAGFSIKEASIDALLDEYKEELYQLRYNYKYKTGKQQRITEQVNKAAEQARLMRKIEQMTVTDEELRNTAKKREDG